MPPRGEIHFWRVATGVALALAAVLALRDGPRGAKPGPETGIARRSAPARSYGSSPVSETPTDAEVNHQPVAQHLFALKNARSTSERCRALATLGTEDGSDEAVVTAIADFSTPAHSVLLRGCAINALGAAANEAATTFLTDLAEDPEISIRLAVVDALSLRHDSGARIALLDAARSKDSELSVRAMLVLAQAGAPEVVALIKQTLPGESGNTAMQLIAALGSTKTPEATAALVDVLHTRTGRARTAAISALGDVGGDVARQALASALGGSAEDSRAVVQALTQIGDERARKVLVDVAEGDDHEASLAALQGLAGLEGDDVKRIMTASLASTDPERAASAASYFGQQGDPSTIPNLLAMTRTAGGQAAQSALSAIAAIGGDSARTALAGLARGGGAVQGQAVAQLAALPGGRTEARSIALEILRSGGSGISMAFETLATDGSKEAREALIQVARGNSGVAAQAMQALARDGDAASVDALSAIAKMAKDPESHVSALMALAATGSQSATPALLAATASADPSVRSQGLAGLFQLGGPEAARALLNGSRDADPSVASGALQYLGQAHTPQAIGRLEEVALGTNTELSQQALGVLSSAAPERAATLAEQLFLSGDANARISAARVAGSLPEGQAERLLTTAARDPDPNVVREAIANLQLTGGPAAQGILLGLLKSDGTAADVRATAAQVLSQLGGNAAEENAALIQKFSTVAVSDSE